MMAPLSIAVVALLAAIFLVLVVALYRRNVPAVVNAVGSLVVALLPILAAFFGGIFVGQPVSIPPELTLWIAAAGCLHSIGMLGPYDWIWWWDHLTHTVSAALVAALVYAALVVMDPTLPLVGWIIDGIAVLTVLLTFAIGIFWELIELVARSVGRQYGIDPILVNYGRRDTILDLVFDVVGALVIVRFDVRVFVPLAERYPRGTTAIFWVTIVVLVFGSIGIVVLLRAWFDDAGSLRA